MCGAWDPKLFSLTHLSGYLYRRRRFDLPHAGGVGSLCVCEEDLQLSREIHTEAHSAAVSGGLSSVPEVAGKERRRTHAVHRGAYGVTVVCNGLSPRPNSRDRGAGTREAIVRHYLLLRIGGALRAVDLLLRLNTCEA